MSTSSGASAALRFNRHGAGASIIGISGQPLFDRPSVGGAACGSVTERIESFTRHHEHHPCAWEQGLQSKGTNHVNPMPETPNAKLLLGKDRNHSA